MRYPAKAARLISVCRNQISQRAGNFIFFDVFCHFFMCEWRRAPLALLYGDARHGLMVLRPAASKGRVSRVATIKR